VFGRFSQPSSDRFLHFVFRGASIGTLFLRMGSKSDWFHALQDRGSDGSSLSRRDAFFQFLKPVQHDVDLGGGLGLLLIGLNHQEVLPVGNILRQGTVSTVPKDTPGVRGFNP